MIQFFLEGVIVGGRIPAGSRHPRSCKGHRRFGAQDQASNDAFGRETQVRSDSERLIKRITFKQNIWAAFVLPVCSIRMAEFFIY